MRKQSNRKVRPTAAPTMVFLHTIPEVEIFIYSAISAFRDDYATPAQFDVLLDTRDLLYFGAIGANDYGIAKLAEALQDVLAEIRDSWDGERFSPISEETLNALNLLADISIDFWKRQSGVLYQMAYLHLKKVRKSQIEKGKANEDRRAKV